MIASWAATMQILCRLRMCNMKITVVTPMPKSNILIYHPVTQHVEMIRRLATSVPVISCKWLFKIHSSGAKISQLTGVITRVPSSDQSPFLLFDGFDGHLNTHFPDRPKSDHIADHTHIHIYIYPMKSRLYPHKMRLDNVVKISTLYPITRLSQINFNCKPKCKAVPLHLVHTSTVP